MVWRIDRDASIIDLLATCSGTYSESATLQPTFATHLAGISPWARRRSASRLIKANNVDLLIFLLRQADMSPYHFTVAFLPFDPSPIIRETDATLRISNYKSPLQPWFLKSRFHYTGGVDTTGLINESVTFEIHFWDSSSREERWKRTFESIGKKRDTNGHQCASIRFLGHLSSRVCVVKREKIVVVGTNWPSFAPLISTRKKL